METKQIQVNIDDYNIIQTIKRILDIEEKVAATYLMEIGLYNIINYPTGNLKIDGMLMSGKFPLLVAELKKTWCV